ncbi:MAG TPA: hypothetical protein VHP12_01420, partial [Chitinophagaceae bacterium]|nr:hypothetical protein [Chitinophagaceae bacterium]
MKNLFLSICCLLWLNLVFAQDVSAVGMQNEFNEISKYGRLQTSAQGFQSYSSGIVNGSQFYYPNWIPGSVITADKELIKNDKYVFLFDKVRQELFIKIKNSDSVLLADKNQIYSFTLYAADKPSVFEPASHFDPNKKGIFYTVLVKNENAYTLLKSVKTTLIKANGYDMEKIKAGNNYDEFKDEITYYISHKNGLPQKVDLKEKSIKKVFSNTKQIQDHLQQNETDKIDEQFLIRLIQN